MEGTLTWERCSWPALTSGAPVPVTGCTAVPSGALSHTCSAHTSINQLGVGDDLLPPSFSSCSRVT